MSIKTDAHESAVLNTMRGTSLTAWSPFAALLTAASGPEAGTVTEISYTGYARVAVTFGAPSDVSGAQTVSNSSAVTYGQMTGGAGGTATHVGIFDASSGGTLRYVIPISPTQAVATNSIPQFAIGALQIGES